MIRVSRPFSWANTALPCLATALLVGRPDGRVLLAVLYFTLPYNLLLYGVNDLFDYDSDRRNPRKGGLVEGGLVTAERRSRLVALLLSTNVPPLLALVWLGGPGAAVALTLAVLAALAYSAPPLRLKERPGLDSATSALHFVLPAICGGILAGAAPAALPGRFLLAFLVWGMASHALGAIQDVEFDSAAGMGSIATVLGRRATAAAAAVLYLAAGLLTASAGRLALWAALVVLPYAALAVLALHRPRTAWHGFLALNLVAGAYLTRVLMQDRGLVHDPLAFPG
ncbi:MAG: prenyltransferase [Candidatus Dormibacteraeota bacterium]|nr:prenyltransferase [Candidatus Dormibacteraeota bacterium]